MQSRLLELGGTGQGGGLVELVDGVRHPHGPVQNALGEEGLTGLVSSPAASAVVNAADIPLKQELEVLEAHLSMVGAVVAQVGSVFAQRRARQPMNEARVNRSPNALDSALVPRGTRRREKQVDAQRKAGIAQEDAQYLKPWAAAIILQYPPSVGDGVVLDMRLQQTAAEQKIPLFGLETMEQQFNIFDSLPQNLQTEMLQDALAYDSAEALNQELIAAYKAADLRTIYRLSNATFAKMKNRDLAAILETRLLTQRNHRMAKKMREPLKQGGQFIAVGALHLLGKTGILAMLERKGYLVQALP